MVRSPAEKQLAKENQRLLKNLKRRIERIKRKYGETSAVKNFEELTNKTTRGLTASELRKQHRKLTYISGLSTSTVKGTKRYKQKFEKIESTFNFDKKLKDTFWSIYDKFTEENVLLEKFKYEIFDTINEYMNQGMDEEQIIENLKKIYNEDKINAEIEEILNPLEISNRNKVEQEILEKINKPRQHRKG